MRICKIWDADYPWDIRVEKICDTLAKAEHEVHLVCRNAQRRPKYEYYHKIHIHRLPYLPKKLGKINYYFGFPAFFNPLWLFRIWKIAKNHKCEIIIVRDLPMAMSGILIGAFLGIPVILDMAEPYPEMLKLIWSVDGIKIQNIFVRNPILANIYERVVCKLIDYILVVVKESKDRLLKIKVPNNKITIVSNTPDLKRFFRQAPSFPGNMLLNRGKFLMLYIGLISMGRGIDFVIDALSSLIPKNKNIAFIIVGKGSAEKRLKRKVEELNLAGHIFFEGYVDGKLIPQYIASSDVCLVPYPKSSHWNNTIPNKLFDYMAMGKPVVVSNIPPMARIVQNEKCGLVFEASNSKDFCRALEQLYSSQIRERMGNNGANAVLRKYNWGDDSQRLLAVVEKVGKRR